MSTVFISRLHAGLKTVEKWENEDLLVACRKIIPFRELCPEHFFPNNDDNSELQSPYAKPDDSKYKGDELLLKRLTLYFKSIMTWVNNPNCELCGSNETKLRFSRGPLTPEDIEGEASRVEVYFCQICNAETTLFPRYNNPKKILETKKGRCGEYANLFGAICRSVGFETRYIVDFTDHVWVEVWSNESNRWIMADGCEGIIDRPSMYEQGWGKSLCYNIAFSIDSITDVTKRYTRQFNSADFQARRRQFTDTEQQSDTLVAQICSKTRQSKKLAKSRIEELDRKEKNERRNLNATLKHDTWDSIAYHEGRISGSMAWKILRGEAGTIEFNGSNSANTNSSPIPSEMYYIECFHPMPYKSHQCEIVLSAPKAPIEDDYFVDCINVMGTPCGSGYPNTISIVVVDEKYSCILQSKVFSNWKDASKFLCNLPDQRIVALFSDLGVSRDDVDYVEQNVSRLYSFDTSVLVDNNQYLFYTGQINQNPDWETFQNASCGSAIRICIDIKTDNLLTGLKLQRTQGSVPRNVCFRLPDMYMTLESQLTASEKDKKIAFDHFIEYEAKKPEDTINKYIGFVTKVNAPVYILTKEAFPFEKFNDTNSNDNGNWTTYHYVPETMWYEEEALGVSRKNKSESLVIDVPIDEGFFTSLLGMTLLRNANSSQVEVSTVSALSNTRLVAFYMSAHWCPPCRKFTPLLCEMYEHLKSANSTHGLEIVFISSDRDETSFRNYFGSMPWLSVPWSREGQRQISERFGVRGIPALIVLDPISGKVVVPPELSRSEVMRACQGGDQAIERLLHNQWFERIPEESKNIMEVLKLSCIEYNNAEDTSNPYLERSDDKVSEINQSTAVTKEEQAARIKEYFTHLVSDGVSPNEAAVLAINRVAKDMTDGRMNILSGVAGSKSNYTENKLINASHIPEHFKDILLTAKRYVENVQKQPWTPKYRNFKLSNKIFDNISSRQGGLDYITNHLGFRLYCNETDFMASIPLCVDTDTLIQRIEDLL